MEKLWTSISKPAGMCSSTRLSNCLMTQPASGPITIDYGPLGCFHDRDSFIALYQSLACQPQVRDSHHGANPEIELLDENHARGRWALSYFNLDAATGMTRRLGVMYDDSYRRIDGQWKIVSTRSTILAEVLGQP